MEKTILTSFSEEELVSIFTKCIQQTNKNHEPVNKQILKEPKPIFNRHETAKMLGVSLPTLHKYTKQRMIIASKFGKSIRYKYEDILNALQPTKAERITYAKN